MSHLTGRTPNLVKFNFDFFFFFSFLHLCSWIWLKKTVTKLTDLTLIITTKPQRDYQQSYDTSLVYPLVQCPRLTIKFLIFPQISDTSSSKLMHLRDYATYFSEKIRINPTRLFPTITSIHLSAPGPMYSSPPVTVGKVHIPPPPPFPHRHTRGITPANLSSCPRPIILLYQTIPLSIPICYDFSQHKTNPDCTEITSSFQFIPCPFWSKFLERADIYSISPNLTISNQLFVSTTPMKRFLLESPVPFILKTPWSGLSSLDL